MSKENALNHITPEERKMWDETDMDVFLYKRLAATICAQSVDEYRDHLKKMRRIAHDIYDYIYDPEADVKKSKVEMMYHEFDTERGKAIAEEHFMLSENWRKFTNINPVWTMNYIREQERVNDAMWTLTLEDVLNKEEK